MCENWDAVKLQVYVLFMDRYMKKPGWGGDDRHEIVGLFELAPWHDGAAAYLAEKDVAFWVKDDVIYCVNERARIFAPDLPQAPPNITYLDVFTATMESPSMRSSRIINQGVLVSPERGEALERLLQENPHDFWARGVFLEFLRLKAGRDDAVRAKYREQLMWLIENDPESIFFEHLDDICEWDFNDPERQKTHDMWKEQIAKHPDNVRVLSNAAHFMKTERDAVGECLRAGAEIEPYNAEWMERQAMSYAGRSQDLNHLGLQTFVPGTPEACAENAAIALSFFERAMALLPQGEVHRLFHIAASMALVSGAIEKARGYASKMLEIAPHFRGSDGDEYKHHGHIVMGRAALREGDISSAKEHLLAAGQIEAPQGPGCCEPDFVLELSGPDLGLAQALVNAGELATVAEYLRLCSTFWRKPGLPAWIEALESGIPIKFTSRSARPLRESRTYGNALAE